MEQIYKNILANFEGISHINNEKSNFTRSFRLLPHKQRVALSNIYALCSYLDDIVDFEENIDDNIKRARLERWRAWIDNIYSNNWTEPRIELLRPLWDTINEFSIPQKYFNELIDGMTMDLKYKNYNTMDDLLSYCYYVAGAVGLITLCILTNNRNDKVREYGINLGNAFQLTNIIRDVYSDSLRGYCYIPQELLAKYDYSFDNIKNKSYNSNFINMMQELTDKAMSYYAMADNNYNIILSFNTTFKNELKVAQVMRKIYFSLLQKIKRKDFNIFDGKISLNLIDKFISIL